MTTKVIDLTQPGGSAGEFENGMVGWFFDEDGGSLCYGIYGGKQGGEHIYVYFNESERRLWTNFSPTMPDWAKVEQKPKKPIELVKFIGIYTIDAAQMEAKNYEIVERKETNYFGFDLIKCVQRGQTFLFFGLWNDGVV